MKRRVYTSAHPLSLLHIIYTHIVLENERDNREKSERGCEAKKVLLLASLYYYLKSSFSFVIECMFLSFCFSLRFFLYCDVASFVLLLVFCSKNSLPLVVLLL